MGVTPDKPKKFIHIVRIGQDIWNLTGQVRIEVMGQKLGDIKELILGMLNLVSIPPRPEYYSSALRIWPRARPKP